VGGADGGAAAVREGAGFWLHTLAGPPGGLWSIRNGVRKNFALREASFALEAMRPFLSPISQFSWYNSYFLLKITLQTETCKDSARNRSFSVFFLNSVTHAV
jgi:hypothetical protein